MKSLRSLVRWATRSISGRADEPQPTPAQLIRAALTKGDAARSRRDWAEAAAAYGDVLDMDPTRAEIWVQRGHALKEQGLLAEAASAYRRATETTPADADAWEQLAHTLKALGDQAGAIRAFREILFIDPNAHRARDELIHAGARVEIPDVAYGQAAAALESARLTHVLSQWGVQLGQLATTASFPQGDHHTFRRQYPIQPPPPYAPSRLTVRVTASRSSPAMLRATLTSLMDQRHQDWVAFVEAPPSLANHSVGSFAQVDPRIRFGEPEQEHQGAPVVLIDAGGVLDREALGWFDFALGRTQAAAVYCDHDRYTDDGRLGHVRHSPQLQSMFDAYDLATSPAPPVAAILRAAPDPTASVTETLAAASGLGPVAHLPRLLVSIPDADAAVAHPPSLTGDGGGSILVIIPTRDEHEMLALCIESLLAKATDPDRVNVLVVDNRSTDPQTATTLATLAEQGRATSLPLDEPFNWPRCNNIAAARSDEDILVFANNDIEMLTQGWDTQIALWLSQPDVGVVGPRMLYPDGSIQHAGILLGAWNGLPSHDGLWAEPRAAGPLGRWRRSHAAAAVTGAFMACRRETFEKVGGFDERLAIAYNDIDFCLKVRALGLKVLYAGEMELIHYESRTRGQNDSAEKIAWDNAELADMHARWGRRLAQDPSYNPQWTSAVNRPYDALHDLSLSQVLSHLDASARANPWAIESEDASTAG